MKIKIWHQKTFYYVIATLLTCHSGWGEVRPEKSLFITDLSVVAPGYPNEANDLSFGSIFSLLYKRPNQARFAIQSWFDEFATPHATSNSTAPALPPFYDRWAQFWPRDSQQLPIAERAPLILNAIVNRLDLSQDPLRKGSGELRFVYQAIDGSARTMRFMVILEFALPYAPAKGINAAYWAKKWNQLNDLAFGPEYNAKLRQILNEIFFQSGHSPRDLFVALRTCEGEFKEPLTNTKIPESRSFRLGNNGRILLMPNFQSPDGIYNLAPDDGGKNSELVAWLKSNAKSIIAGVAKVPTSFLALRSQHPIDSSRWLPQLLSDPNPEIKLARDKFALQTCNGCHSLGETGSLVMTGDRPNIKTESKPSPFLRQQLVIRKKFMESLLAEASPVHFNRSTSH